MFALPLSRSYPAASSSFSWGYTASPPVEPNRCVWLVSLCATPGNKERQETGYSMFVSLYWCISPDEYLCMIVERVLRVSEAMEPNLLHQIPTSWYSSPNPCCCSTVKQDTSCQCPHLQWSSLSPRPQTNHITNCILTTCEYVTLEVMGALMRSRNEISNVNWYLFHSAVLWHWFRRHPRRHALHGQQYTSRNEGRMEHAYPH